MPSLLLATLSVGRARFKAELAGKRNDIEDMCLCRLKEALPEGTKVTILADRGFGDAKLFGFLKKLGFEHVIRFRGDIFVTAADGETRRARGLRWCRPSDARVVTREFPCAREPRATESASAEASMQCSIPTLGATN